jgi:hypothetical protein
MLFLGVIFLIGGISTGNQYMLVESQVWAVGSIIVGRLDKLLK